MVRSALFVIALAASGCAVASAQPRGEVYIGPHPLDLDGRWHLEEGPHRHEALVVGEEPFGRLGDAYVFLADPAAYGWDDEVWLYRGAHPVTGVDAYCGLAETHAHPFAPEGVFRRARHGVHVYEGALRGGLPLATPERMAPERPIFVEAARNGGCAPIWFGGCLWGDSERPSARGFAPLFGCRAREALPASTPVPSFRPQARALETMPAAGRPARVRSRAGVRARRRGRVVVRPRSGRRRR